uniref:Uncharacterized protein n=1 Tax=mine drainage metagenome TaxID=410659 RepID=E6QBD7_9ZZZZ
MNEWKAMSRFKRGMHVFWEHDGKPLIMFLATLIWLAATLTWLAAQISQIGINKLWVNVLGRVSVTVFVVFCLISFVRYVMQLGGKGGEE